MRHKGGPRLLVTDREGALYLERARIRVDDGRIIYHITDDEYHREYNIPHVNLAVLFMGQGTSITQDAMRLLGDEGVHLAVTGSGGSPMHMGALTTYTATRHFREMLPVYLEAPRSLAAAKAIMRDRSERMKKIGGAYARKYLKVRDTADLTRICTKLAQNTEEVKDIQQLLGVEGQFSKACYAEFSRMSGLNKRGTFRRDAGSDEKPNINDPMRQVNHLIDHGNYLCYGMAGAALWALGIPPHMSIFHGKTRAGGLVFDLADGFKDALVLPLAFASILSKRDETPETTFRARMIDAFDDKKILKEAIDTVNRMIAAGLPDAGNPDA
ncbi:CRISP-associated protein Cas1 [Roseivivax halotolerans]|uniref:CRISPR-associated endonuclease Cas1 n=1 Tax=Roseivivax halotolerans TaxID=93684 RepID=A0A1I6AKH2_9RHOB|nr:type I-F CRISPR-associated endonuclease Cas1f [Roseivivax halotolerans]SFQ69155.1 CRISP-associated protein Cas1 [Roseivivax halotolerans]